MSAAVAGLSCLDGHRVSQVGADDITRLEDPTPVLPRSPSRRVTHGVFFFGVVGAASSNLPNPAKVRPTGEKQKQRYNLVAGSNRLLLHGCKGSHSVPKGVGHAASPRYGRLIPWLLLRALNRLRPVITPTLSPTDRHGYGMHDNGHRCIQGAKLSHNMRLP